MSQLLISQQAQGVLRLTLNRPESKNALNRPLYAALSEALAQADEDSAVQVVVIDGAGDSFCAGNDLQDFLVADDPLAASRRLFKILTAFSKPLVAKVQGHAVGIGTTLLLHCDLVLCQEEARFLLPFTRLGLVPEGGSSLLLPQLIGHPKAFELLVMGETCDAATAQQLGLVNAVLSAADIEDALAQRLKRLLALPQAAVRQGKAMLRDHQRERLRQIVEEELDVFEEYLHTPEARAALHKFLN
nr:enoyl-CoA hydratase-related protein [uncultured Halomonas sp.]